MVAKVVQAVEAKVKTFVKNNEAFKRVCQDTFDALDYKGTGKVSINQAAACVEKLFEEMQNSLTDYGILVDQLTSDDIRKIFQECDYDSNSTLERHEFQEFYAKVTTYAAMKSAGGFGRNGRRYGLGMLAGVVGLMVVKRVAGSIPVAGLVAGPLLALLPTVIIGPALGIAAVYGREKGDLLAIRKKMFPPSQAPIKD